MTLTQELRHQYHDLWHRMVTHPFVVEMGDGTLPVAKFRAYFLQDYVFVHDLVAMTSMGLAKAPTFLAASQLHQFLAGILNPKTTCSSGRSKSWACLQRSTPRQARHPSRRHLAILWCGLVLRGVSRIS